MIDLTYPNILDLFPQHRDVGRTDSAAFLIWYLENYYRLDSTEAIDSVCDTNGDRGIDGIFVNDNDQTVTIFQSRISQRSDKTVGDSSLREFAGTLSQFDSRTSLEALVNSAGDCQVTRLINRLDLLNKIGDYDVRGEYVTNIDIDANGVAFLKGNIDITFIGSSLLKSSFISDKRNAPIRGSASFDIAGLSLATYAVDPSTKAVIAPIKARELVALQGLNDQSLFDYNVRGPLGRTPVNKDIAKSIKDTTSHRYFPLFHNGITIVCQDLACGPDRLTIDNYYVVNGCQSVNALYEHRAELTDNLYILTKFVQMDVASDWSSRVTHYSNNQNGVQARDFKSNNRIQIRLKNEFARLYAGSYSYEIKRGEHLSSGVVISNEVAGLYLMSFDLQEPWATHRKYRVFEEKHSEVFARPEVTAHRIVLCRVIDEVIMSAVPDIQNGLFAKYALTRYAILYFVRQVLESDSTGQRVIRDPESFVHDINRRLVFRSCVQKIVDDIIIDINQEISELGEDFDYRGKLRDQIWVKDLKSKVLGFYLKLVKRGNISAFGIEWANGLGTPKL